MSAPWTHGILKLNMIKISVDMRGGGLPSKIANEYINGAIPIYEEGGCLSTTFTTNKVKEISAGQTGGSETMDEKSEFSEG